MSRATAVPPVSDLDFLHQTLGNSSPRSSPAAPAAAAAAPPAPAPPVEREPSPPALSNTPVSSSEDGDPADDPAALVALLAQLDHADTAANDLETRLDGLLANLDHLLDALGPTTTPPTSEQQQQQQ